VVSRTLNILVLEDVEADFRLTEHELKRTEWPVSTRWISCSDDLAAALAEASWDVVISDYHIPGIRFEDTLELIVTRYPDLPVILVSGNIGEERAVELLKRGAWDFVLKDNMSRLAPVLGYCLREAEQRRELKQALAAQAQSEERYRLLAAHAPDVIWRICPAGKIIDVAGAVTCLLGYQAGELIGRQVQDFFHPVDPPQFGMSAREQGSSESVIRRFRHKDGHYVWIESTGQHLEDGQGQIIEYTCHSRDITERREADEKLRLAAVVFANSQEGVAITGLDGTIIAVNPAFCRITGYGEAEVIGRNPRMLKSGRHDSFFYREMFETIARGGYWHGEIWNRRKSGEVFPEWLTISTARNEHGEAERYVATFIDISRLKESEAQLELLAHYDPLTKLPNRSLLFSTLHHALSRAHRDKTRCALLFLDLDHFKIVNDSMGHSVGDDILQIVARRFRQRLRDTDTLARMGGDEFVVLLENVTEPAHAAAVAQNLIDELHRPLRLPSGQEVYLGTSVGISVFPDDTDDLDKLIRNADAAMYQAKRRGRNTFRFYTEALTRAANARVEMETALRRAIEREELVVHYQPLMTTKDRRAFGVEALVRWKRPGGLIPPMQFIPLAEETGLIHAIGGYVLRTACSQMKAWLDAGVPITRMAVNLAAHQFRQTDIHDVIRRTLDDTGLSPEYLELEITESSLIEFGQDADRKIKDLRELGTHISIDDFGTGYSSLAYLKNFAIDKLKIDRTFIKDLPNSADVKIVSAIIALAQHLNLEVLAEGIETQEQLDFVTSLNCEFAQGYYFSPPLEADEITRFLSRADAGLAIN
jgi:diguanylate cyclase (GGDEF)-like protein/PAS domain S-box-containing protein